MDPQAENGQGEQSDQGGAPRNTAGAPPSSHPDPAPPALVSAGGGEPRDVAHVTETGETDTGDVAGTSETAATVGATVALPGEAPAREFTSAFHPADETPPPAVFDPGDDDLVPLELDRDRLEGKQGGAKEEARETRETQEAEEVYGGAASAAGESAALDGAALDEAGPFLEPAEKTAEHARPDPQPAAPESAAPVSSAAVGGESSGAPVAPAAGTPAATSPEMRGDPGEDAGAEESSYQAHAFDDDANPADPSPVPERLKHPEQPSATGDAPLDSVNADDPPIPPVASPERATALVEAVGAGAQAAVEEASKPSESPLPSESLDLPAAGEPTESPEPPEPPKVRKRRPRRRTGRAEDGTDAEGASDGDEPAAGGEGVGVQETESPDALLDYESAAGRGTGGGSDEDGEAVAASGGGWTIPLLCAGLGVLACCLIIPLCDGNRRAAYERLRLRRDLESLQRQVATNEQFLHKVGDDPSLAERLAQRQMRKIRAGTRVLPLHDYGGAYADADDSEAAGSSGTPGASMSPFQIVAVRPPSPLPPYRPLGGRVATLCYNPHSRLYLMGCGLMLLAAGLVVEYGPRSGKFEEESTNPEADPKQEEEMEESGDTAETDGREETEEMVETAEAAETDPE